MTPYKKTVQRVRAELADPTLSASTKKRLYEWLFDHEMSFDDARFILETRTFPHKYRRMALDFFEDWGSPFDDYYPAAELAARPKGDRFFPEVVIPEKK